MVRFHLHKALWNPNQPAVKENSKWLPGARAGWGGMGTVGREEGAVGNLVAVDRTKFLTVAEVTGLHVQAKLIKLHEIYVVYYMSITSQL